MLRCNNNAGWGENLRTRKKIKASYCWPCHLAGGLGFEPRLKESESSVLPLDDPPIGGFD